MSIDSIVRKLFDTWKDSNGIISLENLLQKVYFHQSRFFTLLEATTIIKKTCSRRTYLANPESLFSVLSNVAAACTAGIHEDLKSSDDISFLIDNMWNSQQNEQKASVIRDGNESMDSIRRQICKLSNLKVLESHISLLTENFHLFGSCKDDDTSHCKPSSSQMLRDRQSSLTMSLSEFSNFLAAYFEYSELFSYEKLQQTYHRMHSTYPPSSITLMFVIPSRVVNGQAANVTQADFAWMTFPCYLEFFCRVAILYCSATTQINDDEHHKKELRSPFDLEHCLAPFIAKFTQTSHGSFDVPRPISRLLHSQSIIENEMRLCIVRLKEIMDATKTFSEEILERHVFKQRGNSRSYKSESSKSIGSFRHMQSVPVNVTLLREIVHLPESLDNLRAYTEVLQAQHTKDFELAVTRLQSFQAESLANDTMDSELGLFFILMEASICESAGNDTQALRLYIDALELIEDLSPVHPGRAMAESCVGTTLYYAGEFELSRRYHQEALATRIRAIMFLRGKNAGIMTKSIEEDDFNTARAMNNLACCLYSTSETECDGQACLLIYWAFSIYKNLYGLESPITSQVAHNMEMIRLRQLKMRKKLPEADANMEYLSVISNAFLQTVVPKDPAQPKKQDRGTERKRMTKKKGESNRKQK